MRLQHRFIIGIIKNNGDIESFAPEYPYDGVSHHSIWGDKYTRWRWTKLSKIRNSRDSDFITTDQEEKILKHIRKKYGIKTE